MSLKHPKPAGFKTLLFLSSFNIFINQSPTEQLIFQRFQLKTYLYYSFPVFSFQDQGYKPISNKYNLWIIPDYSQMWKIPNYSQINRLLSNKTSVNDFYPSHYYSNYGSRLNYSHFPQSPKWTPALKKFYEKWGYTGY